MIAAFSFIILYFFDWPTEAVGIIGIAWTLISSVEQIRKIRKQLMFKKPKAEYQCPNCGHINIETYHTAPIYCKNCGRPFNIFPKKILTAFSQG